MMGTCHYDKGSPIFYPIRRIDKNTTKDGQPANPVLGGR
jgi:hypothetical protein